MSESNYTDVEIIKVGDYIVIQRQGFFKLHELSLKCNIVLGRVKVDLKEIVGKPYWTVFRMVPKADNKKEFNLEVASQVESIPDSVMKEVSSGADNRNITDDGKSQLLSMEEIVGMRDSGLSAQNIVGKLIENSTTFKDKTEYSQEKYLKKKEKKYFEYITIRKPSLRLIADIFSNRDQFKIFGMRYDTLAQILSLGNITSSGTYILFETGTQALVGAAILNCLGEGGRLINLSIGNHPQKQAILGMNFTKQQMDRFLTVKLSDFINALSGDCLRCDNTERADRPCEDCADTENKETGVKRKLSDAEADGLLAKKPRWMENFHKCLNILRENKADGLIIASKEFPLNIINKFIEFVKPSRQIVVYNIYREPLIDIYVELKKRKDVIGLHIYETWLRTYQVLADRTHPDVAMSGNGGYLFIATKVMV